MYCNRLTEKNTRITSVFRCIALKASECHAGNLQVEGQGFFNETVFEKLIVQLLHYFEPPWAAWLLKLWVYNIEADKGRQIDRQRQRRRRRRCNRVKFFLWSDHSVQRHAVTTAGFQCRSRHGSVVHLSIHPSACSVVNPSPLSPPLYCATHTLSRTLLLR